MAERSVADFYRENPRMVSSPFGGVDGIDATLMRSVFDDLAIQFEGKRVLDIGCGRAFAAEVVEAMGGEYVGLDFVRSRTDYPIVLGDAGRLPLAAGSFDAVLCFDAFEHFPDPAGAAEEIRRVLKPGAFFFLSVPNYSNVAGLVKITYEGLGWYDKNTWAPFGRWQPQEWESFLTPGRLRDIFRAAGFGRMWYRGFAREAGLGLFPWIDHPRMPDGIRFRLQRLFTATGPAIVRAWPGASLHCFWKIEC